MSKTPLVLGVAGGSGSGKTTVVNKIAESIDEEEILLIQHDSYYRDLGHLSFEDREKQNFDHPSALETELMISHLHELVSGHKIEIPVYDFVKHIRSVQTIPASPKNIILIDGILIFSEPKLRELMNIKIFVDTDGDVRLLRRLRRDINERGRDLDGVLNQYERYVRPMHLEFVEPSKRYADIIIPRGGENTVALEMVIALVKGKLSVSGSEK